MPRFAMITRLAAGAVGSPRALEDIEQRTMARVREECPKAKWLESYAIVGDADYLDLFEAPDNETAAKVALIVRSLGHAQTHLWPLIEWSRFKRLVHALKAGSAEP